MTNVKDLPNHLRPREKLIEKGAANLKDKELLAILLRTGLEGKNVIELSSVILQKYPIDKLWGLTFDQMVKIKGINQAKACSILASFELSRRAQAKFDDNLPVIDSPQKAVDQLTSIRNKKKEHFVALYLNARNQLVHKETISIGTLNSSLVHPREVFFPAIKHHCTNIILAHNHPSGVTEKSPEDGQVTKKLIQSGMLLGIEIVDHLIITKTKYLSFKQENWL